MDAVFVKAYNKLTPADQLLVDALVSTLSRKDDEIRKLVEGVHEMLDKQEDPCLQ